MLKILLIGDNRTARNFGSIATTEALIELIKYKMKKENIDAEIKTIDQRSFENETPLEGWAVSAQQYMTSKIESGWKLRLTKVLQVMKLVDFAVWVKHRVEKKPKKTELPSILEEYSEYAQRVCDGKIFKYESALIKWADLIVINGEGYIVSGTDKFGKYRTNGRYVLFMMYLAKVEYKKKCILINHTVDPQNRNTQEIIKKIYPKLDTIYVREDMSRVLLERWGIQNVQKVADALFSHNFYYDKLCTIPQNLKNFDFTKPYICLGDSSGIANMYDSVKWDLDRTYTELISKLKNVCSQIVFINGLGGEHINKIIKKNGLPSVSVSDCSYHELFFVLKNAQIFISGRWHTSIISLLAHTPILLWGADSHKTEALYKEINYPYKFFDIDALPVNINSLVNEVKIIISENHEDVWSQVEKLKLESYKNADWLTK